MVQHSHAILPHRMTRHSGLAQSVRQLCKTSQHSMLLLLLPALPYWQWCLSCCRWCSTPSSSVCGRTTGGPAMPLPVVHMFIALTVCSMCRMYHTTRTFNVAHAPYELYMAVLQSLCCSTWQYVLCTTVVLHEPYMAVHLQPKANPPSKHVAQHAYKLIQCHPMPSHIDPVSGRRTQHRSPAHNNSMLHNSTASLATRQVYAAHSSCMLRTFSRAPGECRTLNTCPAGRLRSAHMSAVNMRPMLHHRCTTLYVGFNAQHTQQLPACTTYIQGQLTHATLFFCMQQDLHPSECSAVRRGKGRRGLSPPPPSRSMP